MQHLRDGFTRSLLQRMRDQSHDMSEEEERQVMKAIQEFKSQFPLSNVKKGTEFVFTKTRDGALKMEYEVNTALDHVVYFFMLIYHLYLGQGSGDSEECMASQELCYGILESYYTCQ